jgi:hypothetical protein
MKKILKSSLKPFDANRSKNGEGKRSKAVAADCDGRNKKKRRPPTDHIPRERLDIEEDIELMEAMAYYKRDNGRQFPTWSEVLEVLCALGYRKIAEPTQMPAIRKEERARIVAAAEKPADAAED